MLQCNRYHESDKKEKAKEYYEKIKNWLEEKYSTENHMETKNGKEENIQTIDTEV